MRRLEEGHFLSWREELSSYPCLSSEELSDMRRAHLRRREHH
jgi:hypothetical protein